MSSYFLLWHETRPISIRRGSIFILNKYWLLSPWNRNILFLLRFEILEFGYIYSQQRKIHALLTHLTIKVKSTSKEINIMNRSFQSKALLMLNAIPIWFKKLPFLPFSIIFVPMISVCSAVEIIYFFNLCISYCMKRQTSNHINMAKYFIFQNGAEMYWVLFFSKL